MIIVRPLIGAVLSIAVLGCGGGSSSPTSPTATTPPTAQTPTTPAPAPAPPAQPPSNFGVFTFNFDAGASVADQALIGEALQIAHDYFTSALGRSITVATQVRGMLSGQGCANQGASAFAAMGSITICMGNMGWNVHGPITKRKIIIHEAFHVLQFERRWIGLPNPQSSGPMWLIEGVPEFIAYKALDSRGTLSFATAQGCQVKESFDFAQREPPGLPNLSAVETPPNWNSTRGPLYTISMLGVDQLVTARGMGSITAYMDAISNGANTYQVSFERAFGQAITAFYDQFPAYRASLPVPASYLCGV